MLEFWLTADNFQSHLKSQMENGQYNAQHALDDAMIIYDKWVLISVKGHIHKHSHLINIWF